MRVSFIAAMVTVVFASCGPKLTSQQGRGAVVLERYGCGSCHTVKGVSGANGLVGPPLTGISARMYVAGILENTSDNLAAWIHNPKSINPKTAMPNVGTSEQEARDIAAYLQTR